MLNIKNLSKEFPVEKGIFSQSTSTVKAVQEVSFNIEKNKVLGLVGESGSGKSTLGKTIMKLINPTDGEIIFDNENITNYNNRQMIAIRKKLQMIFQDPFASLNPRKNIFDTLAEPVKVHGLINRNNLQEYIKQIINDVGLNVGSLSRYPHEFSGGQRQRISIARALATQPRLLVCDEPTSALDVSIQAQILNLLKDLQEQLNLTILFISHDLPVVRQMCDRIGVLKDGKLCEVANTENIFLKPQHDYTKKLLHLMPKIESIYN